MKLKVLKLGIKQELKTMGIKAKYHKNTEFQKNSRKEKGSKIIEFFYNRTYFNINKTIIIKVFLFCFSSKNTHKWTKEFVLVPT